jgi:ABC-type lipoprotein export system ATPase subunit
VTGPSADSAAPAVRLTRVSKSFGRGARAIRGVSELDLEIKGREFVIITGPSGSGKTTLLNLIAGLTRPDQGRILTLGVDVASASDHEISRLRGREMGFVFQDPSLMPTLNALENILLPLAFARARDDNGRAAELLDRVGLKNRGHALVHELSTGEQRRVAIARALLIQPRLLVCDEPTGDLDPQTENVIMDLISGANREGAAVVMVTHNHGLRGRASRLMLMNNGILNEP